MVDEAGDVDEDVDIADLRGIGVDRPARHHVEPCLAGTFQIIELGAVEIGREDLRAFRHEGLGDRPADPLPRGGDDSDPALKPSSHSSAPNHGQCACSCAFW